MKPVIVLLAALAGFAVAFPSGADAVPSHDDDHDKDHNDGKRCSSGRLYCGKTLMSLKESYKSDIKKLLKDRNIDTDDDHIHNALFKCSDEDHKSISWKDYCDSGCHNGKDDDDDHC
ncbi:unnamed protein product [Discula destructiva]